MSDETKTPVTMTPDAPGDAPTLAKIPRPREQIRVEYTNTAAQLGNLVFQIAIGEQQKNQLMQKLDQLGQEESQLPPEAKKVAPPKLVPTPDGT